MLSSWKTNGKQFQTRKNKTTNYEQLTCSRFKSRPHATVWSSKPFLNSSSVLFLCVEAVQTGSLIRSNGLFHFRNRLLCFLYSYYCQRRTTKRGPAMFSAQWKNSDSMHLWLKSKYFYDSFFNIKWIDFMWFMALARVLWNPSFKPNTFSLSTSAASPLLSLFKSKKFSRIYRDSH